MTPCVARCPAERSRWSKILANTGGCAKIFLYLIRLWRRYCGGHPPVLSFRRTATRDVELAGQRIAAGDKVVVYHVSAHFDERVLEDPFRFDVTRSPNEHLAFGQGPHPCLGAHFGRLQLRIFFAEFLRMLPMVELDGTPRRLTSNFYQRPDSPSPALGVLTVADG